MEVKSHELDIVIDPDGRISVTVKGVSGPQCLELTRDLEAALGVVVDRKRTTEYYEDSPAEQVQITLEDD